MKDNNIVHNWATKQNRCNKFQGEGEGCDPFGGVLAVEQKQNGAGLWGKAYLKEKYTCRKKFEEIEDYLKELYSMSFNKIQFHH